MRENPVEKYKNLRRAAKKAAGDVTQAAPLDVHAGLEQQKQLKEAEAAQFQVQNEAAARKTINEARELDRQRRQAEAHKELASRELARRSLLHFTQRFVPKYDAGWVHKNLAFHLEQFLADVIAGKNPHLLIMMPPRTGKTQLSGMTFPAWAMGLHPDLEIISCAYSIGLSGDISKKVKAIIESPEYSYLFPHTRPNPNNWSVESWSIVNDEGRPQKGEYIAAGVGGGITGKGADILYIDDPVKNAEEADSKDILEKIWTWYGSTAYTRLSPRGGVLVVQTQWSDADLAGRIQEAMKEDEDFPQFRVIKYPAIAVEHEYLDLDTQMVVRHAEELDADAQAEAKLQLLRLKGEALHPARFSLEKLARIKKTLPNRFWSALYQQDPVPDDGAYFSKADFRFAPLPPLPSRDRWSVNIAWDFAISEKTHNDYTVGSVTLQDYDDVLHPVDMVRMRTGDAAKIVDAMIALMLRWYRPNAILRMGVEDGQIWRAISTLFFKELRTRRLYHLAGCVELLKPLSDKLSRARPLQGRMQQGMVLFPDPVPPWFEELHREFVRFPAGAHDDIVDSFAWNAQMVVGKTPPRPPKTKEQQSWRDKLKGYDNSQLGPMAA